MIQNGEQLLGNILNFLLLHGSPAILEPLLQLLAQVALPLQLSYHIKVLRVVQHFIKINYVHVREILQHQKIILNQNL